MPLIPESELWITYARSSGPGGQNVNKRETKAVVRWHVDASGTLSEGEKRRIHEHLRNRISGEGFLLVDNDESRSQEQNRKKAIDILQTIVHDALTPDAPRVPTKPSRAVRRKRLDQKRQQSFKKELRKKITPHD
jgi:ribosome-associated protein